VEPPDVHTCPEGEPLSSDAAEAERLEPWFGGRELLVEASLMLGPAAPADLEQWRITVEPREQSRLAHYGPDCEPVAVLVAQASAQTVDGIVVLDSGSVTVEHALETDTLRVFGTFEWDTSPPQSFLDWWRVQADDAGLPNDYDVLPPRTLLHFSDTRVRLSTRGQSWLGERPVFTGASTWTVHED
jgi:hypothetical protein